jgi:hypothetical protein
MSICANCPKVKDKPLHSSTDTCWIYGTPPSFFVRSGRCPFNPPKEVEQKTKFVNPLKASKKASKGK